MTPVRLNRGHDVHGEDFQTRRNVPRSFGKGQSVAKFVFQTVAFESKYPSGLTEAVSVVEIGIREGPMIRAIYNKAAGAAGNRASHSRIDAVNGLQSESQTSRPLRQWVFPHGRRELRIVRARDRICLLCQL